MKSPSTLANRQPTRQASILVCVLVCLAIVTAIAASTVQSALTARRTMRTQHHLRQTEFLLAAGVQRAAAKLQADPQYAGETWKLSPDTLPSVKSAQIQIELSNTGPTSEAHITARISITEQATIQRSYRFPVEPQSSSEKE